MRPLTADARAVLAGDAPVLLPVFSPRTAALLASAGPFAAPLHLVAMSGAVDAALGGLPCASRTVAARPDARAMAAACLARMNLPNDLEGGGGPD